MTATLVKKIMKEQKTVLYNLYDSDELLMTASASLANCYNNINYNI